MSKGKSIEWVNYPSVEERECDWDKSLPSSISLSVEEETLFSDEIQRLEDLAKLDKYVARMAYRPMQPPKMSEKFKRTDSLAKPRQYDAILSEQTRFLTGKPFDDKYDTAFQNFLARTERVTLSEDFRTISPKDFQKFHEWESAKTRKAQKVKDQKEQLFQNLSDKFEKQCRSQYLNALIHKFADFVADMATTMNIPHQLNEPYARMQRGIFYNIACSLGIQPSTQAAYYYNTKDAIPYETIHKTAHAILCLIIKALDAASLKNPDSIPPMESESPAMDTYIRERLITAATRKMKNARKNRYNPYKECLEKRHSKCNKFAFGIDPCLNI